jgi:hypothetical protein
MGRECLRRAEVGSRRVAASALAASTSSSVRLFLDPLGLPAPGHQPPFAIVGMVSLTCNAPPRPDCSRPLGRECVAAPQSINLPFHVRAGNLANHLGSAISGCPLKGSIECDGNFERRRIGWVWGEVWVGKTIGERVMLDG